jgi:hypothetical protein
MIIEAGEMTTNPDNWDDDSEKKSQLGVYEVQLLEHTGGGGVFGIESLDGRQYDSIVYAQREPRQWAAGSEADFRTNDTWGPEEQVGSLVQVVAAYGRDRVTMYRNGQQSGESFPAPNYNVSWRNGTTRLIFGARSTAYVPDSENFLNLTANPQPGFPFVGKHALTHNPFFSGAIRMATIIRGELLPDEVRGLYEHFSGGRERGCHCYDACPAAPNEFHPTVPVPCAGHGVCLRNTLGKSFGAGKCGCLPGYWGRACDRHCTESGCCMTDDDCLPGMMCDVGKTMCVPLKVVT